MENQIVLSYCNCVLRQDDILLLDEPNWLNDNIISFYFEYLEHNLPQEIQNQVLFICPQVTQCLKTVNPSEMHVFLDPSVAHSKNLIFFCLNDHRAPDKSGGTHWSLLVYCKPDATLYHLDSSTGFNHRIAVKFARYLVPHISQIDEGDFHEIDCLQQENGFDCGVFVLCHTDFVIEHFIKYKSLKSIATMERSDVSQKRNSITKIIEDLKEI